MPQLKNEKSTNKLMLYSDNVYLYSFCRAIRYTMKPRKEPRTNTVACLCYLHSVSSWWFVFILSSFVPDATLCDIIFKSEM